MLHPLSSDHFPQADDNAVVLAKNIDGTRVLLISDLGRPGQNALLERMPDLRADIVVTGLPVQGEPLGDALLEVIQPRVIIVADSDFPAGERASRKLCERLDHQGIPIIYTATTGAVTIEWRNKNWDLRAVNGFRLRSDQLTPRTNAKAEREAPR